MADGNTETDAANGGGTDEPTVALDCRGLLCPEPLMLLRNRVRELPAGAVLRITATDPSTRRDFSNFCRFMGHELIEDRQQDGVFHFCIRKGS